MTRLAAILLSLICYLPLQAQEDGSGWDFSGHGKYQFNGYSYPDDSVFRDALGSSAIDQGMEARLKFSKRAGGWDFQADYQLIGIYADTLQLAGELPGSEWLTRGVINDAPDGLAPIAWLPMQAGSLSAPFALADPALTPTKISSCVRHPLRCMATGVMPSACQWLLVGSGVWSSAPATS